MNTASYNLQSVKADIEDQEGVIMFKALSQCRTLADFEKLLDEYPQPRGVEANFGVIDAQGGAAYYEVNNTDWVKIDVNDPNVAPDGYMVYTNYSNTGRVDKGSGYIRAQAAREILAKAYTEKATVTPEWIFNNLSRSYYNPIIGVNLREDPTAVPNGWFPDADFIPRRITSASIVVKGVKAGENPDLTVMWTVLGYPPCSVAVPLLVAGQGIMPEQMTSQEEKGNCAMCDAALARRSEVFDIHRGNGQNYLNFKASEKWRKKLAPVESKIFETFDPVMTEAYRKGSVGINELEKYYGTIDLGIE